MGPNGLGRLRPIPQDCLFILGSPKWPQPLFGFLGYIEIRHIRGGLRARVNLERPIVLEHLWVFFGALD